MSLLARIARTGNTPAGSGERECWVWCQDGTRLSVIAPVEGAPHEHVSVGYPTAVPEPWSAWSPLQVAGRDPLDGIYQPVPVAQVQALIDLHGGER